MLITFNQARRSCVTSVVHHCLEGSIQEACRPTSNTYSPEHAYPATHWAPGEGPVLTVTAPEKPTYRTQELAGSGYRVWVAKS